jgi:hypothetical protein
MGSIRLIRVQFDKEKSMNIFTLRNVSRFLLILEAIILAWPSVIFLLIALDEVISFISWTSPYVPFSRLAIHVIGFLALISGWRILLWLIKEEAVHGRKIKSLWWIFASMGGILAIYLTFSWLVFLPFVIIFLHLVFEDWRQEQVLFKQ